MLIGVVAIILVALAACVATTAVAIGRAVVGARMVRAMRAAHDVTQPVPLMALDRSRPAAVDVHPAGPLVPGMQQPVAGRASGRPDRHLRAV